jgi:hypothetical protein
MFYKQTCQMFLFRQQSAGLLFFQSEKNGKNNSDRLIYILKKPPNVWRTSSGLTTTSGSCLDWTINAMRLITIFFRNFQKRNDCFLTKRKNAWRRKSGVTAKKTCFLSTQKCTIIQLVLNNDFKKKLTTKIHRQSTFWYAEYIKT